jgi:hypothetical protein
MTTFFESYLDGKEEEYITSEDATIEAGEVGQYGKLQKLVGSNFKTQVYNEEVDAVVLFYNGYVSRVCLCCCCSIMDM